MVKTNWRRGWIPRKENNGTRIGSTAGQPREGGAGLDNDIVDTNEKYINYINSNTKVVHTVDELSVSDTGMIGHYLTLDSPFDNKQLAITRHLIISKIVSNLTLYYLFKYWVPPYILGHSKSLPQNFISTLEPSFQTKKIRIKSYSFSSLSTGFAYLATLTRDFQRYQ